MKVTLLLASLVVFGCSRDPGGSGSTAGSGGMGTGGTAGAPADGGQCRGTTHALSPKAEQLTPIPTDAALVFHQGGQIQTMCPDGTDVTAITAGTSRQYEHAAVSPDRKRVIANFWEGSRSLLLAFDLVADSRTQLVPEMWIAGDGGVDWDQDGFVYFAGKDTAEQSFNDLYRIAFDGSCFERLTDTPAVGEHDPSVSVDGKRLAFVRLVPEPANNSAHTELWVMDRDGSNEQQVFVAGKVFEASAHDPELSPNNDEIVFSQVNSSVLPNFPEDPAANTAHDVMVVRLDGSGLRRLTQPGPISIVPDWLGDSVVYTELNDAADYTGISQVMANGSDQVPTRILKGGSSAKWVPLE